MRRMLDIGILIGNIWETQAKGKVRIVLVTNTSFATSL